MKHWKIYIVLIFAVCSVQIADAQKAVIDKIIGQVGGELVLLSELESQYTQMVQQMGGEPEGGRCMVLESLLANNLLLNQAKLDSVDVTDEEVEDQLDARVEKILSMMNNDITQFQEYYGKSVPQVKSDMRRDMKNMLVTQRMQQQIISSISVTPAEVKSFFETIPNDSLPYFNSEVEIREIIIHPEVNETEKNKSRTKLEELRKRIVEDGEDFAELASIYSDDPGSGQLGGDLGLQRRGSFVPEFEAIAFSLENGDISQVFESQYGFHILQLIERKGNTIHTRHILVRPELTSNDFERAFQMLDSARNLVVYDSLDFSIAIKRFGNKDEQSYNNDGRITNPMTGGTLFEIGDLDPSIYFTIDTMEVGDISTPFEFTTPRGEKHYRIVLLQSRTTPHRANLKEDYSKMQRAAVEEKKAGFLNDWLLEKISNTYIEIDKEFHDCPSLQIWLDKKEIKP